MQSVQQLTSDQLKVRQIAQYYLQLEKRTEPLTHLVRYNPKIKKYPMTAKMPTDPKHFFALIVQLTYLLYTCKIKNINIYIGVEFLVKPPRKGQPSPCFEVYIEYLLDKQYNRMSQKEVQNLGRRFKFVQLTKSSSIFGQFICQFIFKLRGLIKNVLEKSKSSIQTDKRQIQALAYLIQNYLQPQIRDLTSTAVILSLQQSQLFREHSLLLKCFNNSLFISINYFNHPKKIYQTICKTQQLHLKKIPSRKDIILWSEHIEILLEKTFQLLLSNQIIKSQYSIDNSSQNKDKKYLIGDVKGTTIDSRKYHVKIFVKQKGYKPFNPDKLQSIIKQAQNLQYQQEPMEVETKDKISGLKQNQKKFKNQFLIQFVGARSMLSVKYITNIELTVENNDNMMFHLNTLARQWQTISLQFVQKSNSEKSAKSRKKQRYLCIKTMTYVNQHEKIILKILTMIDLLIIYAKISQPLLKKSIINLEDYYNKASQINSKCQHLKDLFLGKVQESYWHIGRAHLQP